MKTVNCVVVIIACGMLHFRLPAEQPARLNVLTDSENQGGWKFLFDGKTTQGWRAYKGQEMPQSWKVVNGSLVSLPKPGETTGDIVTMDEYDNFELTWEWKMAPGGNSGIQYRVTEQSKNPWDSGPEYQMIDNTVHEDGNNPLSSAGACYAVYPPSKDMTKPVGQWNHSRLIVNGNHVEHWLNGEKVVSYEIGSKEWLVHVKTSKFIDSKIYGRAPKGHICLQDYRFPIEFRNIKIRSLPASSK